jgi:hypothetical protein
LAPVLKTWNAHDVVRRKGTTQLYSKIFNGHEFQFEFLANRAVASSIPGKSSGRLALEFTLANIADISADHKAEDMLGINALSANAVR